MIKHRYASLLCAALLIALLAALTMQPVSAAATGPAPLASGLTDPRELEAFLDGLIGAQLNSYHLPGATVAVVKDGELFFAKGYGYADVERRIPVVADHTLFRIGSVSKLLTWTAVMQLAERGQVDLNADVNTYLKNFQIPTIYPEPITLAHLLTHTSGFEDRGEGIFVRDVEAMRPLSEYAARYRPARIRAPGELMAYSNYGPALAGYIVEAVSGMPFEQYVEDNVLIPLGMTHSTFRQPLPPELADDLAVGYRFANGVYRPQSEWLQARPAGALSATATDMARFMLAHLQDGRYGDRRILQEATAQAMHRQHFTQDPRASGWTYGFMEMRLNGYRLIWHGGATLVFHSAFVLLPERNVGLFVSYNAQGGMAAHQALLRAFMDRYYPAPQPSAPQPSADFADHASRFTGIYRGTNHQNETGLEKMLALQSEIPVTLVEGDMLQTIGIGMAWPDRDVSQWVETGPLVFRRVDGGETLIFHEDGHGRIVSFIAGNDPQAVYLKKSWFDTSSFTLPLVGVCLLFFLATMLAWPLRALARLSRPAADEGVPCLARLARWLTWSLSALSLFFVVAFVSMMMKPDIIYGAPPGMAGLLILPKVVAVMAVVIVIFNGLAWVRRYWSVTGRVYYTLLTLAVLAFLWWLNYWNLLFAFLQ